MKNKDETEQRAKNLLKAQTCKTVCDWLKTFFFQRAGLKWVLQFVK